MTVQIRRTEPSDASAIRALFLAESVYRNSSQLPNPTLALWEKRIANKGDNVHAFVAEIGDEVVGKLDLIVSPKDRQRHVASFGMAVKEGYQGRGIGSALLATAIDLADNWLNLHRLELTVYTDNEPAIGLYKKFGFVIEGEAVDVAYRSGKYVNAYYMARIKGDN